MKMISDNNIKDEKLKQKIINLLAIEKIKYSLNNFKNCYTQHTITFNFHFHKIRNKVKDFQINKIVIMLSFSVVIQSGITVKWS